MWQHSFFDDTERVINVASVPQRSPFRYPGGKTWLVPRIRQWLAQLPYRPTEFIEPFAGGGIVSLAVAAEGLAPHVRMVELDPLVAAVWETILHDDGGGGWLRSRWYPETLRKRILDIVKMRDKITFMRSDGLTILRQHAERDDVVFFIDPPYTASTKRAGSRLYTHPNIDHKQLFNIADASSGDFLITYDDAEEVRRLACAHDFDMQTVAMKNTHHSTMKELLIGRNLSWIR